MKIIKISLIIILSLPITIKADDNESFWSDKILGKDYELIDTQIRYRYYNLKQTNEEYLPYHVHSSKQVDSNQYFYTEYSEFSLIKPPLFAHREIILENRDAPLITVDEFDKIAFNNFYSFTELLISEITVFNKYTREKIPFYIDNESIYQGDINKLSDNNLVDTALYAESNSNIILKFYQNYNLNEVEVRIYLSDNKIHLDNFQVEFYQKGIYSIARTNFIVITQPTDCIESKCKMTFSPDNSWARQYQFVDTYYSYRDKLFLHYDLEKDYLDGYYEEFENYTKDEEQPKIFYLYQKIILESKKNLETNLKEKTFFELQDKSNKNPAFFNKEKGVSNYKDESLIKEFKDIKTEDPKKTQQINNVEEVIRSSSLKNKNRNIYKITKIIVVISIVLCFLFLICKILYKRNKKSRMI